MDRTYTNYSNHYRGDSPDRPQNQPCSDFCDPYSILQALQNNQNFQDPQFLNKVIIPMLLVQLLQNQQNCQHCADVNRQAPSRDRHQPRRQRSFHNGLQLSYHDRRPSYHDMHPCRQNREPSHHDADPPVQEVYPVPPGRYRSSEYILGHSPPAIPCSDEDIRQACCDSRPELCDPMRRRNLIPSRSLNHNHSLQIDRNKSLSPSRGIVERCYWCRQQLYRFYDPDLHKRVFTHVPCHRGAILAPAGKSSDGSIKQTSLVDMSPFNPDRDVMLPCPYLCAKTETTYNSSYRHPEVVARESFCRLVPKKSQPWEQTSGCNVPFGQSSLESIGRRYKPELPRPQEERVMFVKPNYCPSDQDQVRNTSMDGGLGSSSRIRRPGPCVTFSPSTDSYQEHRSVGKKKHKEQLVYYNCHTPRKSRDGGYDLYLEPDPPHQQSGPGGSSSPMEKEKVSYYNCHSPKKSEDGGYDLSCKPDPRHQRHGSGRRSRSSSRSSPARSRHSHHSRGMSTRSRAGSRSGHGGSRSGHGGSRSGHRHSRSGHRHSRSGHRHSRSGLRPSTYRHNAAPPYRQRRHSAPYKSRSRGSWSRRPRAKSDYAMIGNHQHRHHSHSSRRRRRHASPWYSMSDPAINNQRACEGVCCPCPPSRRSVYKASYGNPAEHPYYEGPSYSNFRRQRIEMC